MQVTYQQTLDDWIAAQIFGVEQLSSLTKHDKKSIRRLLILFVALDAFLFVTGGSNIIFWLWTILFAVWIGYFVLKHAGIKRKMICRRLLIAYGPEFENEKDRTVVWDISSECIRVTRGNNVETRFPWEAVRRIVVCPDYLFIDFGGITGWLSFPGGAVPETVYQAFCEEVIRLYRTHAARDGKIADVIHSEWAIDLGKLKASSRGFSLKRIIFTLLWGLAFLIVGFLFLSVASLSLGAAATVVADIDTEVFGCIFGSVVMIGSFLFWLTGIALSLFGKLPGTRARK